jgi:hypothetical protein
VGEWSNLAFDLGSAGEADTVPVVSSVDAFVVDEGGGAEARGRFMPAIYVVLHDPTEQRATARVLRTTMNDRWLGKVSYTSEELQADTIRELLGIDEGREPSMLRVYVGVVAFFGPGNRRFYPVELALDPR